MTTNDPKTLLEAIRYFQDPEVCREFMIELRWPDGVIACPTCGQIDPTWMASVQRWQCKAKHAKRQFSIKVGTVMEDSPIAVDKWLATIWLLANNKNGISSYELARDIGVTQKSAWFMLHRIRAAMEDGTFNKLNGTVEADETWIGGKARNMHKARRAEVYGGAKPNGYVGKAGVMGFLERNPEGVSRVRTTMIDNPRRHTLEGNVRKHVETGANLYTDGAGGYRFLGVGGEYGHAAVEHDANEYVRGDIHTNGIENFWALVKRALHGTYVSVEPFHLFRYLDEEVFRFNSRDLSDGARFKVAARAVIGKRLTWAELTAVESASPA